VKFKKKFRKHFADTAVMGCLRKIDQKLIKCLPIPVEHSVISFSGMVKAMWNLLGV
jgi:hypothetical protein